MRTVRRMTADELLRMPDDGRCYELIEGELRESPPTGYEHGDTALVISYRLAEFVYRRKLGRLLAAETGFRIGRNPDTMRAHDVAFIRAERVPEERTMGYFQGAPDLAVEVVSPNDTPRDVHQKALDWIAAGVPLVWVADPGSRSVRVYSSGTEPVMLQESDYIDGGDVMPGFRCRVAEFLE